MACDNLLLEALQYLARQPPENYNSAGATNSVVIPAPADGANLWDTSS